MCFGRKPCRVPKPQRFILNETSYHGRGAINEIAGEVKRRHFKKALVCSDPDLLKFNVTQKVRRGFAPAQDARKILSPAAVPPRAGPPPPRARRGPCPSAWRRAPDSGGGGPAAPPRGAPHDA